MAILSRFAMPSLLQPTSGCRRSGGEPQPPQVAGFHLPSTGTLCPPADTVERQAAVQIIRQAVRSPVLCGRLAQLPMQPRIIAIDTLGDRAVPQGVEFDRQLAAVLAQLDPAAR